MQKKAGSSGTGTTSGKTSKNGSEQSSGPSSRSDTPSKEVAMDVADGDSNSSKAALKRKLEQTSPQPSTSHKKPKTSDGTGGFEEAIRRYLTRKPMTTKELLKKFTSKSKHISMGKEQLVNTIAEILKKLNPEKQKIKDELYLTLKP